MAGGKSCSSLVSPESSIGGHSDHQYAWHGNPAGPPKLYDDHSMASRAACDAGTPGQQQRNAHDQPQARPQLPDLDSSQPGPIEIDTSLLYTPESGASSADVSQSGTSCYSIIPSYSITLLGVSQPLLNLTSVVSCVCMFAACCKDRQGVSLQLNAGRHILPPCRDRPNNIRVCIDMLV